MLLEWNKNDCPQRLVHARTLFPNEFIKKRERVSNCQQCANFDDENTLAALQAITIYTLLRISEQNEDATTFDIPLIYTMIVGIPFLDKDT
jgi:hypothetical protein